ncbi:MAG TPA: response regulator [Chloroflexota bacterium]
MEVRQFDPSHAPSALKRVLVVEDDVGISDILALVLTSEGYDVARAFTLQQALEAQESVSPDLITLDVDLGGESGLDLLRRLKSDPRRRDVPVLIVSAHVDRLGGADRRMAAGVIEKPFDIEDLLDRVAATIGPACPAPAL